MTGWDFSDVSFDIQGMGAAVVGYVLASRRPANRIGWLFLAGGLVIGLTAFSRGYALHALLVAAGSWPAGRASAWLAKWIWVLPGALLPFVFLIFPTGRLRSRRWLPAAWFAAGVAALTAVVEMVDATRFWSHPLTQRALAAPAGQAPALLLLTVATAISVAAAVVRFARSSGEERMQLKWFAAAAVLAAVTFTASSLTNSAVVNVLPGVAVSCLLAAITIAVLKYRLYDIDLVISKAVLYGSLAMFITAVYVGLVAGVGTLVGGDGRPLLAAFAAAVVAIAFQPARQWAGRLANRVVYGRRATPYQVLSDFARRIGGTYSSEDVLHQMARIVAAGTGADQVVVWLRLDDELCAETSAGASPDSARLRVDDGVMPPVPGSDMTVPIVHHDGLLGAISIRMPKAEPLRPAGQQLVRDVASQAGLALANAALIEDLRASRQRLVSAQDEARRLLERNIHDGAQQDLVAMAIKLRLAVDAVSDDPARQVIDELQADAARALANLRDLARGIYPPLLADHGLVAALNAQVSRSTIPVAIDADGIGRFGQDAEVAVYFCCLEALQNMAKHAMASAARIRLQAEDGVIGFSVSDDGLGYDVRHTPLGSGQRNMADRLAALGGRLEVRSTPGHGTTITGHLPGNFPAASAQASAGCP